MASLLLLLASTAPLGQLNKLPHDGWPSSDTALDCAMRQLGYEYAAGLQVLTAMELADVAAALQLDASCPPNGTHAARGTPRPSARSTATPPTFATTYYVDATDGSDSNAGTEDDKAFKSVAKAVSMVTVASARPVGIMLRGGMTHRLSATIELGPEHSGTTFLSHPFEGAILSGSPGDLSDLTWKPASEVDEHFAARADGGAGIIAATVPAGSAFIEMFANGNREIRARWPNGNQNRGAVYPEGFEQGSYVGSDKGQHGAGHIVGDKGAKACRHDGGDSPFQCNSWLAGGPGNRYDPPVMFNDPDDLAYEKPVGFSFNKAPAQSSWTNVGRAIMTNVVCASAGEMSRTKAIKNLRLARRKALHKSKPFPKHHASKLARLEREQEEHAQAKAVASQEQNRTRTLAASDPTGVFPQWGGWISQLATRDGGSDVSFVKDMTKKGMWQDQAQTAVDGDIGAFFVENIKEELDVVGEWYLDTDSSTLYYMPNSTVKVMAGNVTLEAPMGGLITLVHMQGSKDNPVRGIIFEGITFKHAEPTQMRQYYIPSCGDWSIFKGGAVMIEGGAEDIVFNDNIFENLGGNALFVYGYMSGSKITQNEFKWIGDSAIALLGRATLHDATGGFMPQNNEISGNHAHETGLFDFQSSFYFESIAGHNIVKNNIAYNGPRAAVNFNDGGPGGSTVEGNLLFGHGRESSDHGPINSWDRCPFQTLTGSTPGKATSVPAERLITRNFVMNGGILYDCITHDDGASYYLDLENVLLYGGSQNNNAYHNDFLSNLLIQPHVNSNFPAPGYTALNYDADCEGTSSVHGNTVVMKGHTCNSIYGAGLQLTLDNDGGEIPHNSSNNHMFNDAGKWDVYLECQPSGEIGCYRESGGGKCTSYTLSSWQNKGLDASSTVDTTDAMGTPAIISAARAILSKNYPTTRAASAADAVPRIFKAGRSAVMKLAEAKAKVAAGGAACTGGVSVGECATWQMLWTYSNGPFWKECSDASALTNPCGCSMVTCSGGAITSMDLSGGKGIQGTIGFLLGDTLPSLTTLIVGEALTIKCTKSGTKWACLDQ